MSKLNRFYKCAICGNIVEIVHTGSGQLVCCGQPMNLLEENKVDAATEKHVPVVEKVDSGFLVKIGAVPHPMEDAHYIEWVEVYFENTKSCRKFLKPGDKPEVEFKNSSLPTKVVIYCNLHGLWSNK